MDWPPKIVEQTGPSTYRTVATAAQREAWRGLFDGSPITEEKLAASIQAREARPSANFAKGKETFLPFKINSFRP